MTNEKNKIEALLFSSGRRMKIEDISNLTGIKDSEAVKKCLQELKIDLENRGGSLMLNEDGEYFKMTVKDHYMPIIQRVVSRTELDRPLMETLAVIAWKYPVVQADVIKIRHNKAYDHMKILEEQGFITRAMFGRTKKITLTEKFFEYFDLPTRDQVNNVFQNIVPLEIKGKLNTLQSDIEQGEKLREEALQKQDDLKKKKEGLEKTKNSKRADDLQKKEESESAAEGQMLSQLQEKEDKEIEEIEHDIEDIEKEEEKNVYADVPEVQEQDEVSSDETGDSGKE